MSKPYHAAYYIRKCSYRFALPDCQPLTLYAAAVFRKTSTLVLFAFWPTTPGSADLAKYKMTGSTSSCSDALASEGRRQEDGVKEVYTQKDAVDATVSREDVFNPAWDLFCVLAARPNWAAAIINKSARERKRSSKMR